ncbi:uncharacterized protein LOC110097380 isoform X2 [Dendrobium catenatum]|uniref:SLH domain-containing protein n=1 Tax=Dendrobium catenatum TaxID=906689 RepID=A0A2I0WX36_9ASPA|nr:uncharacterized protein LOC110097380 isoform X2 [Dendrobium catenatum]PKU80228.1 hypothetical protein MA16_Dca005759 [Dendrobium catenatum]
MASLGNSLFPGSLQVRSIRRGHESSSVLRRIRFRLYRPRIVLASASRGSTNEDREGQSWSIINKLPETFAGWSGLESEGGGNSQEKGGRGGMLGAGLAGLFLFGGLTFATLSLRSKNSRNTFGVNKQMKPLTTEQEVLLTSDDQSSEIVQDGNETSAISSDKETRINDHNPDSVTGINKDPFPPLENSDITEDKHDIINQLVVPSAEILDLNDDGIGSVDRFNQASGGDDLHIETVVDDISVPADSNPFLPEFYANNATDLTPNDLNTMESQSIVFSGSSGSTVSHNENLQITNDFDSLSFNTFSTDYAIEQGNPSLEDIVKSNDPLDILSEYEGSPGEPLSLSGTIQESSNSIDTEFSPDGVIENVDFVSKGDDFLDNGLLQLSPEGVTSGRVEYSSINTVSSGVGSSSDLGQNEALVFPADSINIEEGFKLEEATSITYSVPVYANHTENEPNISIYNRSNKDSTFESILPQKSFLFTGVPAPSLVSSALQVPLGKVLVPAVVDQVQSQAFAALQVLKVIEASVQPGDLCTRREYARWLVFASSALSRNTTSKLYPAMYIENVTELAFDDITPEDPDFSCIQGLAEAGIIFSKLSLSDTSGSSTQSQEPLLFSPESLLSRQDLVSWKMALERKQLPELLYQTSGFIDIEKIDSGAWPALLADLSSGEQGIISLAFGYTRLFQPNKPVTKAQAAIALATGEAAEIVGEELARIEAESLAETAVNAHTALVAQVEKDLNASFEQELAKEREKINALEKLAEEARLKLERIRTEREEENNAILRGQAAVKSEMEVLSRLRCEVQEQLQELMTNKVEISFERERITKLQKETESENQVVVQLQYELEVERKALSMARTWAEEEAKRARELARALEEARERWIKHGIKVVVDEDLQEDATTGITWATAGKQSPVDETISRGENLVEKLNAMAAEIKLKSSIVIKNIIHTIVALISALKRKASESSKHLAELQGKIVLKAGRSLEIFKESASVTSSNIAERARRVLDDCKESVEKISPKFKA